MLEQIKFINHLNESMEWGKNGIYVNYNDLHDYSWSIVSENNKISQFEKGIVNKTIPLKIYCTDIEKGLAIKNQLMEIAEKDVLAMEYGKIIIGDYYLKCYITGSTKGNYLIHKGYLEVTLTIATDLPQWVCETTQSFFKEGNPVEVYDVSSNYLDYPFDYSIDYLNSLHERKINNTNFVSSEFEMIIYGAVSNPVVFIGGHAYEVCCEVSENEYLTINSRTKTIVLTRYNGEKVNCFKHRNKQSYVFEKIPSGNNIVVWNGNWGFDITLFEERSEPKWI